jgi:hypothetical protein
MADPGNWAASGPDAAARVASRKVRCSKGRATSARLRRAEKKRGPRPTRANDLVPPVHRRRCPAGRPLRQPVLPGLSLAEDCIRPGDERAFITTLDAIELMSFRFQGWLGNRLTASFGWRYSYGPGHTN